MVNTGSLTLSLKERWEILHRDGFACRYCGAAAPEARLHVDHVIARTRGGTNEPSNLVTACEPCNQGKRDSELVLVPEQRHRAVFGHLISGFLERKKGDPDARDVLNQIAELFDFVAAELDPVPLMAALYEKSPTSGWQRTVDWEASRRRLREIAFGPWDA